VGARCGRILPEARITHERATADAAGHRSRRRCRSIALGGTDGICVSRNRWLDLAPDHNSDPHASHGALNDRGDVAAHLPSNRPKQSRADERSRRPSSIRCPNLGFFCLAFSGFARGIRPVCVLGPLPELNYPMFLLTHRDLRKIPRVNAVFEFCLSELKSVLMRGEMKK
jgi:hypothetical protein